MRLTTVLLIASLVQVSAAGFAQKLSLNVSNSPLKSVFRSIRSQSGYNFVYAEKIFESSKPVTLNLKNADFAEVMEEVFKDQPLSYQIENKTVVVKVKEAPSFIEKVIARFQGIDVSGKVVDEQGRPVPGATVRLKNGKGATITDARGDFLLKNVDEGVAILISYIGYNAKEVIVKTDMGVIKLDLATSKLDEVIVKAYGTTTERMDVGGGISSISAKQIENKPITNALLALQGEVPGVFVTQSTGYANSGVVVQIRGQNSLTNGNNPLYVIDGIPYNSDVMPPAILNGASLGNSGKNSAGEQQSGNPLAFINPQDIESISILKDADATSIYGSRAASGAILITTKKGKAGKTAVSANLQSGWNTISRYVPLLTTPQYLAMRREAFYNDSVANPGGYQGIQSSDYDLNGTWDSTRYTDWQKVFFRTGKYSDAQLSISGGSTALQFLLSGNYHSETSVYPGFKSSNNIRNEKANVHFSVNYASGDQKFKAQLSGSYMADLSSLPTYDLTSYALQLSPVAPSLFNEDGSLNWAPDVNGNSTFNNPLAQFNIKSKLNTGNLVSNALISYDILNGLTFQTRLGYTNMNTDEVYTLPRSIYKPENRQFAELISGFSDGRSFSWNVEPQINFKHAFANSDINILVGATVQRQKVTSKAIAASGFSSELLMENLSAASAVYGIGVTDREYKYNAAFGLVNYNWQKKYLASLSIRRDGSSRFGYNNLFHNFWSAAGAWVFSEEGLLKNSLPFLSLGKVRASYGTNGNDQIADYQYLELYNTSTYQLNYQGQTGLSAGALANPNLQWESIKKMQFGLDLGFFSDRVVFNLNYYRNRSSNQLVNYILPIITGFNSIVKNLPATVQNSGIEFAAKTVNIEGKNLKWTSSFNISFPQTKLVSFPNLESSPYAGMYIVGQPLSLTRVYHFTGIDPATGLYTVQKSTGESTTSPTYDDRTVIINNAPKFYGGLTHSISYKGIQLDLLFQFTKQKGRGYIAGNYPGTFNSAIGNQPTAVLEDGKHSKYSATYTGVLGDAYAAGIDSDFNYGDASFVRLKNVSLSWQISERWISRVKVNSLRLFVNAQNLWTITKYVGINPENPGSFVLPALRVITTGINITL